MATAEAPYAEAMKAAGIFGFPLALLAAGIAFGGDFSTLNASISTTPRYLFTMARDGAMPKIFAKVSRRYQTRYLEAIQTCTLLLSSLFDEAERGDSFTTRATSEVLSETVWFNDFQPT